MNKTETTCKQRVSNAFGIASVEGKRPSVIAMDVSQRYAKGEITATQAKELYLKANKLVP